MERLVIGQKIRWQNSQWKVVASDTTTSRNPAYPKWDYILMQDGTNKEERVVTSNLNGIEVLPVG